MSRDDPVATHSVDLGECDCPGSPHDSDSAEVVDRHDYGGMSVIAAAASMDEPSFLRRLIRAGIKSWNLVTLDKDGNHVPLAINDYNVERLAGRQQFALLADINKQDVILGLQLPNTRGAPSGGGRATKPRPRTSKRQSGT